MLHNLTSEGYTLNIMMNSIKLGVNQVIIGKVKVRMFDEVNQKLYYGYTKLSRQTLLVEFMYIKVANYWSNSGLRLGYIMELNCGRG